MRLIKGCLALQVNNCINCKHCLECYGKYDIKKIESVLKEGFNCPKMDEGLFEDRLITKEGKCATCGSFYFDENNIQCCRITNEAINTMLASGKKCSKGII